MSVHARWNTTDFGRFVELHVAQGGPDFYDVAKSLDEWGNIVVQRVPEGERMPGPLMRVPVEWVGPICEAGLDYSDAQWRARYKELESHAAYIRHLLDEKNEHARQREDTVLDRLLPRQR